MKRSTQLLAILATLMLLTAACDSESGGTLTPDTGGGGQTDVVEGQPDGTSQPGDTNQPGSDVLPGTDGTEPTDDTVTAAGGVAELQQATIGIECDPSTAFVNHPDTRTFEGLVVMSPRFEAAAGLWGYYVAEASGPWHGVKLAVPADMDGDYQIGDVLTVTGEGVEYYCMTQFKALQAPTVTGQTDVPAPVDVAPETVAPTSADAESYEGVLVRLSNVNVATAETWGFTLEESGVTISDSLFETGARPAAGCAVTSVVGIVDYSFEKYQIIPVAAGDIVYDAEDPSCAAPACAFETVSAYQQSDASANCDGDGSQYPEGGSDCALSGLVVVSGEIYVSSSLRGHYVMEPAGGAWSGILMKYYEEEMPDLAIGDTVDVTGEFQEYYCLSQFDVADPATDLTKTGTADVPAAEALTPADLDEQWEGVLAVFTDQVLSEVPSDANHWQVTFESGLRLDDLGAYHYDNFAFEVGQSFATITGVVSEDTYNKGTYFVVPRDDTDLVLAQ